MKLIPTATLALAVAIEANPVASPVGPLVLSNARFADGEWNTKCGPPEKGIDGAGIGLPDLQNKPELVHSKSPNNPEFLVDLPENAAVSEVVFYPRNSKWKDHYKRYQSLTISVGDTLCEAQQGLGPDDVESRINTGLKWNCNFAEGDSISVKNKNNYIHFTELTAAGYIKPSGPTPVEQCEAAAKAAAEQSAAQIAFLVENVESCEQSAGNTQNAIADLQKQLQARGNIILDLQKTIQDNDNANVVLLQNLQKTVADLQQSVQNKENVIADLQKSVQEKEKRCKNNSDSAKQITDKQIADLEEDVAACEKEVQDAQNANADLQKTVQNKEQEIVLAEDRPKELDVSEMSADAGSECETE